MCTVTYIPTAEGVLLTSNRDERADRPAAMPPQTHHWGGQPVIYPKDTLGGGTWITLRNGHSAAVLLNGGFEKHTRQTKYRQSRGIVMLEVASSQKPAEKFNSIELFDIEPFSLILFSNDQLLRCTWDGIQKHVSRLDPDKAHIWSSATLYNHPIRHQRETSLREWLTATPALTPEKVLAYHLSAELRYETCGTIPNMKTVSVTSLKIPTNGQSSICYHELSSGKIFATPIRNVSALEKHGFDSFYWKARRFLIRLQHWEYWPFECVYLPLVPLWLWLSMRARSLLFFSAANPGIENSGFIHERKSAIYPLLPESLYPKTILCQVKMPAGELKSVLLESSFAFPLIAKPDIGERGIAVKLLQTQDDLEAYHRASQVDFLLQEYMDYPHEIGVFYYRFPGEDKGSISGIVGKEFLHVTGDGKSDLLSLLMQNDRAILQLDTLSEMYSNQFGQILAAGDTLSLVPYGNHSRGCKFIDFEDYITPELTSVIDHACQQVRGFYFGRLDIRFKSWEDLTAGRNFSIIELNGTGSEPTHIYDPRHSILYAWKEIYRHWKIVFRISINNVRSGQQRLMTFEEGIKMYQLHRSHLKAMQSG